jgi:hypothetical protein
MNDFGIITRQGIFGDESLCPEFIDDREYEPEDKLSARLHDHDNSAFDMLTDIEKIRLISKIY